MRIEELDRKGLDGVLRDEHRAVLVDCWSPWCAPCRALRPHLERLADEYRDRARIVAVNVEEHQEAAEKLGVQTLPTLILFEGGSATCSFIGPVLPSEIAAKLDAREAHGAAA